MDDPTTENNQGSATPPPSYSSTSTLGKQERAKLSEDHGGAPENNDHPSPQSAWARWQKHTLPERVMAYFTGVVAICAALQVWILIGGSGQTDQLIKAANINACAAQKSAQAAHDFAIAAQNINGGVRDAVIELDAQAKAVEESRKSSVANSMKALNATIDNFHLEQRAWVGVRDYQVSPIVADRPVDFRIQLANSGKTPALHFKVDAKGWFSDNAASNETWEIAQHQRDILPRGDSVIAPQAIHIVRNEYAAIDKLPGPRADAFAHGQLTYFITGVATYIDSTQGKQTMTFCIDYSEPGPEAKVPASPRLCEHGNSMSYEKEH